MRDKNAVLIALWLAIAAAGSILNGQGTTDFKRISKAEIALLLQDVAKSNPMALKRLAEDPEMKKSQIDSLKQLLAFASQAQKDGLADDRMNQQELENIRSEVTAINYDREINKNKGSKPPFGFISEANLKAFWVASPTAKSREMEFQQFMDSKLASLKASNPAMKDRELSDEEREQARDFFAKIEIYDAEYKERQLRLPKTVRDNVALQVKLRQAQFLARLYSEKMAHRTKATDAEVEKYISGHPELDSAKKKAKAEQILKRAKAGEDFAKLADEFSEDPGNKDSKGVSQGGIYRNVRVGTMVPPFERAALALEPGQVASELVESDFGYHIIKLEKKGKDPADPKSERYDVRHILISTTLADPDDPQARDVPVKTYVRNELEAEKEKQLIAEIVLSNNISVPDDFVVPVPAKQVATAKKKRPVSKKRPVKEMTGIRFV
jgi:parvulin-like peptidyl-prolyl isomerase